jgi:hypothetical protein
MARISLATVHRATSLPSREMRDADSSFERFYPGKLSTRARRNMVLKVEVRRVFDDNFRVYGVRSVWQQLRPDMAKAEGMLLW